MINLQSTKLFPEVGHRFCGTLGELTSLTKLDVRNCGLTKQADGVLTKELINLKNLTYLDLSNNPVEELAG